MALTGGVDEGTGVLEAGHGASAVTRSSAVVRE
jgi:hypothetical protein